MPNLVTRLDSALDAIRALNENLHQHPELADRLGQAHAFYVLEDGDKPLFGFSKFVGYEGLTAEGYLRDYKSLDGRNTEHALSKWFEELRFGTPAYEELFEQLTDWLSEFGKRPRGGDSQKVRLMVLRPEYRETNSQTDEDRRLLELMLAVADLLPAKQRLELRAAL
ncbi:hypothetical protein IMF23_04570 [Chelatococcus daeguensis]|uniref:hypothetical protein n=1 Tax=Chelatococcus daeguensis TaxID=444444 RepID=UPI0007AC0916|nr:hypothetical protein [Chelatococcus daeguensis]KZE33145.1 hypothetical protein AVW15_19370 [Chelatococcus daeguensis]MBM3082710.1 hypothetical protein [Chelatococcus daeguensis]